MRMRVRASSAPNGSSASSSSGSRTSERASATRCASPPDSSLGHARSRPARPDLGEGGRGPGRRPPAPRAPNRTLSSTRFQGSSRASWNTTEMRSGTASSPVPATSWSSPASARSSVLLPDPLWPSRATNWPGGMVEVDPVEHGAVAEPPGQARDADGGRGSAGQGSTPRQHPSLDEADHGVGGEAEDPVDGQARRR